MTLEVIAHKKSVQAAMHPLWPYGHCHRKAKLDSTSYPNHHKKLQNHRITKPGKGLSKCTHLQICLDRFQSPIPTNRFEWKSAVLCISS